MTGGIFSPSSLRTSLPTASVLCWTLCSVLPPPALPWASSACSDSLAFSHPSLATRPGRGVLWRMSDEDTEFQREFQREVMQLLRGGGGHRNQVSHLLVQESFVYLLEK